MPDILSTVNDVSTQTTFNQSNPHPRDVPPPEAGLFKFRLLTATHVEMGEPNKGEDWSRNFLLYRAGDIIESKKELDKMFNKGQSSIKFERLDPRTTTHLRDNVRLNKALYNKDRMPALQDNDPNAAAIGDEQAAKEISFLREQNKVQGEQINSLSAQMEKMTELLIKLTQQQQPQSQGATQPPNTEKVAADNGGKKK